MVQHKQAFTLIELLVVVLIISILAAVAVPQYQKVVYKSRTAEAVSILRTIHQAQEVYFLTHGTYNPDMMELDIEVPTDLIATNEAKEKSPNKYFYNCAEDTCFATVNNNDMPSLEYHMDKAGHDFLLGKFWCKLGDSKSDIAKSVCQGLGKLDTSSTTSWFVGNYYLLN